mgnify:CR=1 FL=1
MADAYLAMALLAGAELYAVGLLHYEQFAGAFELTLAKNCLLPIALGLAAPCALVAGLVMKRERSYI